MRAVLRVLPLVAALALPLGLFLTASVSAQDRPTTRPTTQPKKRTTDPEARKAIDRYIEAIGGTKRLAMVKDRTIHFLNKKFQPTGTVEMRMSRYMKGQYLMREEWTFPGMGIMEPGEDLTFVQVYDGDKGWVKTMGYVSELDGKTLTMFVWDKYIDDFFLHFEEDGYHARYIGRATVEDKSAHEVEVISFAGTHKQRYFFSEETGLLVKKKWKSVGPTGPEAKEMYYTEYTKIRLQDDRENWVKIPINEKIFTDGELDLERDYTEITLNSGLDNSLFARPEGQAYDEEEMRKKRERRKKEDQEAAASRPSSQPKSRPQGEPTTRKK